MRDEIETVIPTDGTKWCDSNQALMFMLKGYPQNDINRYQNFLDNRYSWERIEYFEYFIDDNPEKASEGFLESLDQMERD